MKQRNRINVIIFAISIIAIIIIGVCCAVVIHRTPSLDTEQQSNLKNAGYSDVVWGTSVETSFSVENSGLFYIGESNSILMYYDFNTEENYVLCSSPNCKHNDSSCPANVRDYYKNYTFAYYQGRLYLLSQKNYESEKIELISMDVDGQNRRTVVSLDPGDYSVESWAVNSINPVYFAGGKVFLTMDYIQPFVNETSEYINTGMQLLMIDLTDGSITELTDIMIYNTEAARVKFTLVTEKFAVYEIMKYEIPYLFEWEYIEKYGEEAYQRDYYKYYRDYENETDAVGIYRAVNLDTGQISEIWSGKMYPAYGEESSAPVMMGPDFTFSYDGNLYYTPAEYSYGPENTDERDGVNLEIHRVDPATGEDTNLQLFSEIVDAYWYIEQSSNGGYLYNKDEILVCNDFFETDTFCLYKYSLSENELTEITRKRDTDTDNIWGVTDQRVIFGAGMLEPLWVTKDEYEKGNFSNAVKIRLRFE